MNPLYLPFLILFLFSSTKNNHKFYLSVTEIEYKTEQNSLQIISRVFIDDLENALRLRYDDTIRVLEDPSKTEKEYLEKYLTQKFKIEVEGKPLKINYLGRELDKDIAILYIEVEAVPQFKNIKVQNAVLTDMFDDQKNLVHIKKNGISKSMVLVKEKDTDRVTFN